MNGRQAKKVRRFAREASREVRREAVVRLAHYKWWVKPLSFVVQFVNRHVVTIYEIERVRRFIARHGIVWPTEREIATHYLKELR